MPRINDKKNRYEGNAFSGYYLNLEDPKFSTFSFLNIPNNISIYIPLKNWEYDYITNQSKGNKKIGTIDKNRREYIVQIILQSIKRLSDERWIKIIKSEFAIKLYYFKFCNGLN